MWLHLYWIGSVGAVSSDNWCITLDLKNLHWECSLKAFAEKSQSSFYEKQPNSQGKYHSSTNKSKLTLLQWSSVVERYVPIRLSSFHPFMTKIAFHGCFGFFCWSVVCPFVVKVCFHSYQGQKLWGKLETSEIGGCNNEAGIGEDEQKAHRFWGSSVTHIQPSPGKKTDCLYFLPFSAGLCFRNG